MTVAQGECAGTPLRLGAAEDVDGELGGVPVDPQGRRYVASHVPHLVAGSGGPRAWMTRDRQGLTQRGVAVAVASTDVEGRESSTSAVARVTDPGCG